jgi:hypothetical protein
VPLTPEALIFHRLEIPADDGIAPSLYRPRRLKTLDGKKKNGPFEKLCDPESAYRYMQKWRFFPFIYSSTTGLSLTRSLAGKIFPLPEERAATQDACLAYASMLLGTVYGTSQVLGSYFIHGKNFSLAQAWAQIDRDLILENFLNDILEKTNKKRIASFFESRQAQAYYRYSGSTKDLLKLAWKIPARSLCWETILFSIQTHWHCLKSGLGIKKKHRGEKTPLTKTKNPQAKKHSQCQP